MPNPRTPRLLAELAGTGRPDRTNQAEPNPPAIVVGEKPPAWIRGPRARRAWASLVEMAPPGLITTLDTMSLGLLVNAFEEYLAARDVVEGRTCGYCGTPMRSRRPCTATALVEIEPEVDEELEPQELGGALKRRRREERRFEVVTLAHEPGRPFYTTRTKDGSLMIRRHPAAAAAKEWHDAISSLLSSFGMKPADRSRVSAGPTEGTDPAEEFLRGRGVA